MAEQFSNRHIVQIEISDEFALLVVLAPIAVDQSVALMQARICGSPAGARVALGGMRSASASANGTATFQPPFSSPTMRSRR